MLSKSKIVRGVKCHKSLWLYKNHPELRSVTDQQQAIFDSGTDVGLIAQGLFPGGIDVTADQQWPDYNSARRTDELISLGITDVIYEATFIYNDVLVAVDLLVRKNSKWYAYEVKSSTKVKEEHFIDAAIQYYVIKNSGLDITNFSMVTINSDYVRKGKLELSELFKTTDITEEVEDLQDSLPEIISELKEVQSQPNQPEIEIGPHCFEPYECDFKNHCWKDIPDYSVFNLTNSRGKEWELYERGIELIEDIPFDISLNDAQRIQVETDLTGRPYINEDGIRRFLDTINYPIYHFDFETVMPSIPMFDESRPYQQIPFQYSVHIESAPGMNATHKEYLDIGTGADPRPQLIQAMLSDLGTEGTILAYNSAFEVSRIKELARDFPQFKTKLNALIDRFVDLAIPFRKKYYYTKEMQGRYSIKKVLPALVPDLTYSDLAFQEGGTASSTFLTIMNGNFNGDVNETKKNLLEYCKMDTLAMVEVLKELKNRS